MTKGYVYVLSNPSMPGLVKIGWSFHGGEKRGRELSGTGVPTPFQLEFEILAANAPLLESAVHQHLGAYRPQYNREFFKVTPSLAVEAIFEQFILLWRGIHVDLSARGEDGEPEPKPDSPEMVPREVGRARAKETLAALFALIDEEPT